MKKFALVLLFIALCCVAAATGAQCDGKTFSLDQSIAHPYYYSTTTPTLHFSGCFPSNSPINYEILIESEPCFITSLSLTSLSCQFLTHELKNPQTIQFTDVLSGEKFTIDQPLTQYYPQVEYLTPYSLYYVQGKTNFRVAVKGFPATIPITAELALDGEVIPDSLRIVSITPGYIILQLNNITPQTGPNKAYTLVITDTQTNNQFISLPNAVYIQSSSPQTPSVHKTSPDWLLQGQLVAQTLIISGNNLAAVKKLAINHPFTHEQLIVENPLIADNALSFTIPAIDFEDRQAFPKYDPAKYGTISMYRGPTRYELLDVEHNILTSSEIVIATPMKIESPLSPNASFPVNLAMSPKDDIKDKSSKISVSFIVPNFAADLSMQLSFDLGRWVLPHGKSSQYFGQPDSDDFYQQDDNIELPGYYYVREVQDGMNTVHRVHFLLPPVLVDKYPLTAQLCFVHNGETACAVQIGLLTYTEEQQGDAVNLPTFIKADPAKLPFDAYGVQISNFHYSVPILSPENENKNENALLRFAYKHVKSGKILDLKVKPQGKHLTLVTVNPGCAIPDTCPEGLYKPVLLVDEDDPDVYLTSNVAELAEIDLSMSTDSAYRVGIVINSEYNRKDSDTIMAQVRTAIVSRFPYAANILAQSTGKPVKPAPEPTPDPHPTPDPQSELTPHPSLSTAPNLNSEDKTMAFFVVRPVSVDGIIDAKSFVATLKEEFANTQSPLYTGIPNLSPNGHVYIPVTYCPLNFKYLEQDQICEDRSVNQWPRGVLVLIGILGAAIAIALAVAIFFYQTKRLNQQNKPVSEDFLGEPDGGYQQIQ